MNIKNKIITIDDNKLIGLSTICEYIMTHESFLNLFLNKAGESFQRSGIKTENLFNTIVSSFEFFSNINNPKYNNEKFGSYYGDILKISLDYAKLLSKKLFNNKEETLRSLSIEEFNSITDELIEYEFCSLIAIAFIFLEHKNLYKLICSSNDDSHAPYGYENLTINPNEELMRVLLYTLSSLAGDKPKNKNKNKLN